MEKFSSLFFLFCFVAFYLCPGGRGGCCRKSFQWYMYIIQKGLDNRLSSQDGRRGGRGRVARVTNCSSLYITMFSLDSSSFLIICRCIGKWETPRPTARDSRERERDQWGAPLFFFFTPNKHTESACRNWIIHSTSKTICTRYIRFLLLQHNKRVTNVFKWRRGKLNIKEWEREISRDDFNGKSSRKWGNSSAATAVMQWQG
jgi:hypothetical protein